jgi:hypothetical protein
MRSQCHGWDWLKNSTKTLLFRGKIEHFSKVWRWSWIEAQRGPRDFCANDDASLISRPRDKQVTASFALSSFEF